MRTLIYTMPLLAGFHTFASEENLLKCADLGLFVGDCVVASTTLFPETATEREFQLQFLYNCKGHDIQIGFEATGFYSITSSAEPQNMTVTGRGLEIVDKNPEATSKATFDSGCELRVLEKRVVMSDSVRSALGDVHEEALVIAETLADLHVLSGATADVLKSIDVSNLEELSFQRDQLIVLVKKAKSPAIQAMMDNVVRVPSANVGQLQSQYNAALKKIVASGLELQTRLLNRLSELKFRTLEILVDAQQEDAPEWSSLLQLLEGQLTPSNGAVKSTSQH